MLVRCGVVYERDRRRRRSWRRRRREREREREREGGGVREDHMRCCAVNLIISSKEWVTFERKRERRSTT